MYSCLLSAALVTPHCEAKFFPQFGPLYWSCTWRQLFFLDLNHQVIDLAWKVTHGVLYIASRLVSFGYSVTMVCFCGPVSETLVHLFIDCPLSQSILSWLQSLMFRWSCLAPSLECRHVLFGFNSHELRTVPRVFCYLLNVVKYYLGSLVTTFVFTVFALVLSLFWSLYVFVFAFAFPFCSSVSARPVVVAFSSVSGVLATLSRP